MSGKTYPFHQMNQLGKLGEKWFQNHYPNAQDVSGDKFWQNHDVDFLIGNETYEVKTAAQQNAKLFFETDQNGKPGCLFQSSATWWLFYILHEDRGILIHMPTLKRWLFENSYAFDEKTVRGGKAKGYAISIDTALATDWAWEFGRDDKK